jgi:hypothetical protein
MGVVQARADCALRDAEDTGDLRRLVAEVMAHYQHGAFVRLDPAEAALEFLAVMNGNKVVAA